MPSSRTSVLPIKMSQRQRNRKIRMTPFNKCFRNISQPILPKMILVVSLLKSKGSLKNESKKGFNS